MTQGKASLNFAKVLVVLLIAGILGGFFLPHFIDAIAGGYSSRTIGASLGAKQMELDRNDWVEVKSNKDKLALAKVVEAGYFDKFIN